MTTPVTTPAHKAPRRTGRRAAVLAASAALIATPMLAGATTPAMAEDGNTYFKTEQEVYNFINKSAPLYHQEAIKGYPVSGQDSQKIKLQDVEKVYPHAQALKDVPTALGTRFNLPGSIPTEGPDIRTSSSDDKEPWLSSQDAKSMCGQPSQKKDGEPMPCGFVGVLDKAYPKMLGSSAVMGKAQFDYTTQATVGQDTSQTSGWSVGGKVSSELTTPGGPGGGKAGSELNFTYSESTTTTNKWTTMTQQTNKYDVPNGISGWVEGRANGGWYLGYIVYKLDFADGKGNEKQKMVLIPARVLIQAPGNSVPMTFVKRQG
ncbi:hypothetical protein [Streptomyces noursei]|uniref:hypothetical protein n=1 Tax=Streptomyces noursei TaxID=1971 RepID=UPI0016765424|nr:hypothetical protein [Streptomyces noursei]MCZ1019600.1 hypothetical protein [Streptomyces noursei]GGX09847.1 hypothetical protein GCM10010341_34440 [Streptomyces noursei]